MSSIETINNNGELTSTNNSKDSGEFVKVNNSINDLDDERGRRFSFNNSHNSEELISEHRILRNLKQDAIKQGQSNKNVKIASCLDKWYRELKGNVLVSKLLTLELY